ncbi:MAG: transposase [Alphaproteobacteria bacterium]|uniref:Transposase n=1 Tax=Candidatus Nitrobium versatile TaxID=2884831 RepID=A0A953M2P0_9BACT|nr:transposase [Candidatus Nitrobium versatile]
MARPLRIEYEGAVYHVTSRGNARQRIFYDDEDRASFLGIVESVVKRFNWLCHAYCLMNNHYHLLIETPDGNLSKGMRQLNGVYTQAYNRRHGKEGHVFQGRYKAILVEKESHLGELCRYVVLNPVRAKIVDSPDQWEWSSYGATTGEKEAPECLTVDWVLGQFSQERGNAQRKYREFVHAGMRISSPWLGLKGQIFLGGEDFAEKMRDTLLKRSGIKEIPKVQRYAYRPALAAVFESDTAAEIKERNRKIYEAHVRFAYTLKEIADFLGLHYTTVSRAIKEMESDD